MNKIKVTQEQADVIESTSLDDLMEWFYMDDDDTNSDMYKLLKEFNVENLAKAKIIGCETVDSYRENDYVFNTKFGNYGKVIETGSSSLQVKVLDYVRHNSTWFVKDVIRATKEEVNKEKNHLLFSAYDRKIWELKKGDILRDKRFISRFQIVNGFCPEIEGGEVFFHNGTYGCLENIKKHYEVVCFAEDRTDLKGDLYA